MTEENKIMSTTNKLTIGRKIGLHAKLAEARSTPAVETSELPNRIVIVFDDSGSMHGPAIENAKKAVGAFLRNCNPSDTAIALYPLCAEKRPLTNNFPAIDMMKETIQATGGTPLYTTLTEAIDKEKLTRAVVFSDGEPTDEHHSSTNERGEQLLKGRTIKDDVVDRYIKEAIAIDTIYIGREGLPGYTELKWLSAQTNGIFMHFTDSSILAKSLKYLAPQTRLMLMNEEIKAKVERGEM